MEHIQLAIELISLKKKLRDVDEQVGKLRTLFDKIDELKTMLIEQKKDRTRLWSMIQSMDHEQSKDFSELCPFGTLTNGPSTSSLGSSETIRPIIKFEDQSNGIDEVDEN